MIPPMLMTPGTGMPENIPGSMEAKMVSAVAARACSASAAGTALASQSAPSRA